MRNNKSPRWIEGVRAWLRAARLRTLPLACSAVALGGGLAAAEGYFRPPVFVLSVLTAVLLQVLSNFANDYGDAVRGADGPGRVGPRRSVASGELSAAAMFRAVLLLAGLCLALGAALLTVSFGADPVRWFVFLALGLASVAAAVLYTMGRRPYGYRGYGDFCVFVFFGLVAVAGSYALYGAPLVRLPGLPACAAGFFATAVININNIRDMENDSANGKETLALRLGPRRARMYHLALIGLGLACWAIWLAATGRWWGLALLASAFPLVHSAWRVYSSLRPDVLDAQLRVTSMSAGFVNSLMALALVWL
ncbi:MAG: 1,4-dihydroxy-2-naphthoate octaprenyltransferase [Desulfovibrionaceae bacterium]|nr:1,4-dihydroxy-2-naphthoate octaprenyltransferase [Desulfovibrionaceae bacterium]